MNKSNFKILSIIFVVIICIGSKASAQKLKFLIPDGAVIQHAGSIGYLSAGINYDLFRKKRGSLDFMYGYLPESKGGNFSTATVKFAYRPFEIKANQWLTIYPINPGTFISYTLDKNFDLTWDKDQYPKGYYYWSEALRFHAAFGTEFKINTNKLISSKKIKSISLYYEINTNDVYVINYFLNKRYLDITGIFKAGVGLKASF